MSKNTSSAHRQIGKHKGGDRLDEPNELPKALAEVTGVVAQTARRRTLRADGSVFGLLDRPTRRTFPALRSASGVLRHRRLRSATPSGFRPQLPLRDSAGLSPDFPPPIRTNT
jgi:hypothetical protein